MDTGSGFRFRNCIAAREDTSWADVLRIVATGRIAVRKYLIFIVFYFLENDDLYSPPADLSTTV